MSTLIKYGIMAAAVLGVVFGIYSYGKSSGYEAGQKQGFTQGAKSRDGEVADLKDNVGRKDATIKQLTDAENKRRDEANKRIDELEKQSQASATTIADLQKQLKKQRDDIITSYITKYPTIATQCGLSQPTVETINSLLIVGALPNE